MIFQNNQEKILRFQKFILVRIKMCMWCVRVCLFIFMLVYCKDIGRTISLEILQANQDKTFWKPKCFCTVRYGNYKLGWVIRVFVMSLDLRLISLSLWRSDCTPSFPLSCCLSKFSTQDGQFHYCLWVLSSGVFLLS